MRMLPDRLARALEPVPGRARPRPVRNGVMTLLVFVALIALALGGLPSADERHVVRAEFRGANVLESGDPVRMAGVDVGEVDDVALTSSRTSMVTMRIDDDIVMRRDAEANVYWRTLLGGTFYVELEAGSPSAPELGEEVIPIDRTTDQVEFDDFFQPFDGPTRRNQQTTFRELDRALRDPDAVGRLIDTLRPSMSTIGRGLEPLRGRDVDDLRRLVASGGRVTSALARTPDQLSSLIADANATLAITRRRREQLGQMIELSPATLDATEAAMRHTLRSLPRLDALVSDLRPSARALAPSADATEPALRQAEALLREARPLLRATGPLFERLGDASRAGVPLVEELAPTVDRLNEKLIPSLRRKDPETDRAAYQMIGPALSVVAGMSSEFDAAGYWLRFPVQGDERSVGNSPCQPFFTDPSEEEKLRCEAVSDVLPGLREGPPR